MVNRREGVRDKTIARVEAARGRSSATGPIAAATRLARNQSFRFAFILPTGANSFMTNLTEQVERTADWLVGQRAFIDILHVDVFDPDALAGALEQLVARLCTASPRSRSIIRGCAPRSTISPPRCRGRDAGVGRAELAPHALCRHRQSRRRPHRGDADGPLPVADARGAVGVIAGSLSLRDHAERQFGFHQILSSEYPDLVAAAGASKGATTASAPAC